MKTVVDFLVHSEIVTHLVKKAIILIKVEYSSKAYSSHTLRKAKY